MRRRRGHECHIPIIPTPKEIGIWNHAGAWRGRPEEPGDQEQLICSSSCSTVKYHTDHEELHPLGVLDLFPLERVYLRKRRNIQIKIGHKKVLVLGSEAENLQRSNPIARIVHVK